MIVSSDKEMSIGFRGEEVRDSSVAVVQTEPIWNEGQCEFIEYVKNRCEFTMRRQKGDISQSL